MYDVFKASYVAVKACSINLFSFSNCIFMGFLFNFGAFPLKFPGKKNFPSTTNFHCLTFRNPWNPFRASFSWNEISG